MISAAMIYIIAIGKKPVANKVIKAVARVQKTDKSKYSAIPVNTPSIIPFLDR